MARAKNKKPYYLYSRDAIEWTIEDENAFDYTKLLGYTIYYLSRTQIEDEDEVTDIPVELTDWLTAYETNIVLADNEKKAKRAAKRLEMAFKEELDNAISELSERGEENESG